MSPRRVLVVDDDADMSSMLARHLESEGMAVTAATGGREALKALAAQEFDVVITDLVMDEVGGLEVLATAARSRPAPRVILMTAFGTLETAIAALRQGAYDYLAKPFKLAEVTVAVSRALDDHRLRRENERLRAEVERQQGMDRLLGRSRIMQETVGQVRAVAESDSSVLLLGESGTGKELVAQAIHWASPRCSGRFVAVNCAAVPETLLESELFGHEKGAFTGADRRREGLFAAPTRAPCSSTRWAICRWPPRPSSSGCSRIGGCGWEGRRRPTDPNRGRHQQGASRSSRTAGFARISTIDWP